MKRIFAAIAITLTLASGAFAKKKHVTNTLETPKVYDHSGRVHFVESQVVKYATVSATVDGTTVWCTLGETTVDCTSETGYFEIVFDDGMSQGLPPGIPLPLDTKKDSVFSYRVDMQDIYLVNKPVEVFCIAGRRGGEDCAERTANHPLSKADAAKVPPAPDVNDLPSASGTAW